MKTVLIHKRTLIICILMTTISLLILYRISYGNDGTIQSMPTSLPTSFTRETGWSICVFTFPLTTDIHLSSSST